ncbi:MAG: glycosyltransferase [Chloroflexota bacterium]|nr:glycosyltransferase [Chloroflexota bacterium]
MLRCTVGVLAYNEEHNIRQILHALLNQQMTTSDMVEIVVVASGCTDQTVELAQVVASMFPIVKVVVQRERAGKAAAINLLISIAQGDVIVLAGADTLPDPIALEQLLRPFNDPTVGMVGAHVIPLNDPRRFLGFAVQMLWQVHHRMALRWPKLGELVAFRNVVQALPVQSATDEVALEALITAQNYRLVYVPDAVVYNYGPQTFSDFLLQRRRIYAGHLAIAASHGYVAASMPLKHVATLVRESLVRNHRWMLWLLATMLLEFWARILGYLDFTRGYEHHIWRPIKSTKELQKSAQQLTLVGISISGSWIRRAELMHRLRRIPPAHGTLFWWDHKHKEVIFLIASDQLKPAALQERITMLAAYIGAAEITTPDSNVKYRVVEFSSPLMPLPPTVEQHAPLPYRQTWEASHA